MNIVIVCEAQGSTPLELTFKARSIAPEAHIIALCEGTDTRGYAACGADEIVFMGCVEDDCQQAGRIAQALEMLKPDSALFPATVRGRFLSAWVAAKLDTGLTADCTELAITPEGLLKQIRPAFGGNLTADILCKERRPQLASVRPGVFLLPESLESDRVLPSRTLEVETGEALMRSKSFQPVESGVSLQNAKVIVAGGKGIGSKEGFAKLAELAALLGGAVGATRSAVDAGWISYEHQIGQTGVAVHPELYIAFGISGFVQHTVGMNASGTVVAVNTDRNAPIFSCADYGIVADWEKTIDAMIQQLKK